jgi:hypothetical protein
MRRGDRLHGVPGMGVVGDLSVEGEETTKGGIHPPANREPGRLHYAPLTGLFCEGMDSVEETF